MNATDELDRFQLVSSLYGPGNFTAWLCTLASVLISWTLHPEYTHKDTITNDVIITLVLPIISAGDFLHQLLIYRDASNLRPQLVIGANTGLDALSIASAIEAPLTICEDFSLLAPIFFAIAINRGQHKRSVAFLLVGLQAFSLQIILFILFPGISVNHSNFARPFLFEFLPALVIAICWYSMVACIYIIEVICSVLVQRFSFARDPNNRYRRRLSGILATLSWVVVFFMSTYLKYGFAGNSLHYMRRAYYDGWSLRFVPKSALSMNELDQAVAVLAGLISLLFSILGAVKARRRLNTRRRARNLTLEHIHRMRTLRTAN